MSILSYYFAMSIDGYIARNDDGLDWLESYAHEETFEQSPYRYEAYYETVTSVIMGRKTYEVIDTLGGYPYSGKHGYIISNNASLPVDKQQITVLKLDELSMLASEKKHYTGRMWLVGGGMLAGALMNLDLIDELIITVLPCTLGSGIRWATANTLNTEWFLHNSVQLGDIMQFQYIKLCK